jgi:phosphomannomutase
VSGGTYAKIQQQLGDCIGLFEFIFAENGTLVYQKGNLVHCLDLRTHLTEQHLQRVVDTLLQSVLESALPIKRGKFVDFRTGMIYFSPTGGDLTPGEREQFALFDEQNNTRGNLVDKLQVQLGPDLDVKMGGQIGIAIHPHGWDKSLVSLHLNYKDYKQVFFFGDRCGPDGNDYPLYVHPEITSYQVSDPKHTLKILRNLFS